MNEEQLRPAWGYDLNCVLSVLGDLLLQCHEISSLEEKLAEVSGVAVTGHVLLDV